MTIEEFQHDVFDSTFNSSICDIPIVRYVTPASINLRIPLTFGNFIDIFYNEETGTTAFALIEEERRVFGADNTGGWHIHPFEKPDEHEVVKTPVNVEDFLRMVEDYHKKA